MAMSNALPDQGKDAGQDMLDAAIQPTQNLLLRPLVPFSRTQQ